MSEYPQKFLDGTPVPPDYQRAVARLVTHAAEAEELYGLREDFDLFESGRELDTPLARRRNYLITRAALPACACGETAGLYLTDWLAVPARWYCRRCDRHFAYEPEPPQDGGIT